MAKFQQGVLISPYSANITARLANGPGATNHLTDADVGKFVKLVGDSQYGLTAAGNGIEGIVATANEQDADGFKLGGLADVNRARVTFNGLQASAGTGSIAVGDFVVSGAPAALGTKLTGPPAVLKATDASASPFKWRVVAIVSGAGAVGSLGIIERV